MAALLQVYGRSSLIHNVGSYLSRSTSTKVSGTSNAAGKPKEIKDNNSLIQPVFYNRNPRNLELMTIASKPQGYHLDNIEVEWWHRLVVSADHAKVTAEIIHNSETKVVSASSGEFCIRRFLYRPVDVSAYKTVGKVLAQRCLESGINTVFCDIKAEEGTKLSLLLREVKKGGLVLEEAPVYTRPIVNFTRGNPTKPWDIVS